MGLTITVIGAGLGAAAPASAGGVGGFLSPAFGITCANHNAGARADGSTRHATGTVGGNLAGVPIGSPFNHCGGADLPDFLLQTLEVAPEVAVPH
ncbi:chaplin family protein [Streptomyces lavendofoliae]|uniref:chaplin family protein n=1 Tax=Streptomyces lavendofoliae TaxID=67314 RepID=UPI003D8E2C40